jgi:DNA-binding NtrC family response regulator
MGYKILIVEDQFIEANDLQITLTAAGHVVTGIAKSYDHALLLVTRERPEIILLDIFLKGPLTGIDLAQYFNEENIPFIYLSANSNASTLEAAKATQPYGFLVKPFREKDLLVALDIASYRHRQNLELVRRQERQLSHSLYAIVNDNGTVINRLLLIAKAFAPFIPFNYAVIDMDISNENLKSVFCFERTGFDDYLFTSGSDFLRKYQIRTVDYQNWRSSTDKKVFGGETFEAECRENHILHTMREQCDVHSGLSIVFKVNDKPAVGLHFFSKQPNESGTELLDLVMPLESILITITENIKKQQDFQLYLSVPDKSGLVHNGENPVFNNIIGKSAGLLHILDQAIQVSPFDTTVLILGETGVGKEGLVKVIHEHSARREKPLIKINCAAIPATLIESELFGYEKGAFTGAWEKRAGKFEQAGGGTLFLDEIGEIPMDVQTKLLRVLQEKEFERVGGRTTIKADVRIVAATNRNLHDDVAAGRFRMDLYYRINVFPIKLSPLRERKEDIPLLVDHFLKLNAKQSGRKLKHVGEKALTQLANYSWPGNIRELQHVIERHVVITETEEINRFDLPNEETNSSNDNITTKAPLSIADAERVHIMDVLAKTNGKISGLDGAAELLNVPASTLRSKMRKLGISWKYF